MYRKIKDRNTDYKKNLIKVQIAHKLIDQISSHDNFDYCLVLRSDFFHDSVLVSAKNKSSKIVSYHYDGIRNNSTVLENITYFDRFYVFDRQDLKLHSDLYLSNNFYFDFDIESKMPSKYDVYFLGFYNKGRERALLSFIHECRKILKNIQFTIVFPPEKRNHKPIYESNNIECLNNVIPFEEYITNIKSSRYIVDFLIAEHEGLSFRIFEGIKYRKKVITTNQSVKTYDFYHPSNFLIIDEDSITSDNLQKFFDLPYEEVDSKIYLKYSFTNWFYELFNY